MSEAKRKFSENSFAEHFIRLISDAIYLLKRKKKPRATRALRLFRSFVNVFNYDTRTHTYAQCYI